MPQPLNQPYNEAINARQKAEGRASRAKEHQNEALLLIMQANRLRQARGSPFVTPERSNAPPDSDHNAVPMEVTAMHFRFPRQFHTASHFTENLLASDAGASPLNIKCSPEPHAISHAYHSG